MAIDLAQRRVNDFQQRCGRYGETALHLAYHAALPVALNAELLHLLRINFFLDPPEPLPSTVEFEFLLSPLCREIDEGLYEIEPEIRDRLLAGLSQTYPTERTRDIATLLWQYIDHHSPWSDRVELERAQQLTALNFLNPQKAQQWLAEVETEVSQGQVAAREWYVAMRQEINNVALAVLNEFIEGLEAGNQASRWIAKSSSQLKEAAIKQVLYQFPEIRGRAAEKELDDFSFSIEQFLEQIAHALEWGDYSILHEPQISLVFDSFPLYMVAFQHIKAILPQQSLPPEVTKQIEVCLDYLLSRLDCLPATPQQISNLTDIDITEVSAKIMSLPDELKPIFDRIAQHQQTAEDMKMLRQHLSTSTQLVSQQGKYNVNLEQGQDIHIGDRIYQGADAETIRNIVQAMVQELQAPPDEAPVNEPMAEATQMSSGQRQRLEQRQSTLQAGWDLRDQKIQRLRSALAIEAGTSVKFQLEREIAEEEVQLAQLSEALDQIERTITAAVLPG
jgi:Effector-associated domain 10